MRFNLVYIIQISVVVGVPDFGPAAGKYQCHSSDWHYATSFYVGNDKKEAEKRCTKFDCDILVEWTRRSRNGQINTGYDIGKYGASTCPPNEEMTVTIIYEKPYETYINSNNTGLKKTWFHGL